MIDRIFCIAWLGCCLGIYATLTVTWFAADLITGVLLWAKDGVEVFAFNPNKGR